MEIFLVTVQLQLQLQISLKKVIYNWLLDIYDIFIGQGILIKNT